MDRAWWNEYGATLAGHTAELWTTNREAARIYRLNHIDGADGAGISKRANTITLGGNSGYQAVALAVHFGAARVVLLGYDMRNDGRLTHWHGNHARLGNPVDRRFREWIKAFETLRREATECKIVNASRVSDLPETIPRIAIDAAVNIG